MADLPIHSPGDPRPPVEEAGVGGAPRDEMPRASMHVFHLAPRSLGGRILLGAVLIGAVALALTLGLVLLTVLVGGGVVLAGVIALRRLTGGGRGGNSDLPRGQRLDPDLEVHAPDPGRRTLPPPGS